MARNIFLIALLASAILAYVQSTPVPDNSSKTLILSADLPEPEKSEVQNNMKEHWANVGNIMIKNYKLLHQDPNVSNDFLNLLNTAIDKLKLSVDENIDSSNKLNDSELDNNEQVDSWDKFQKETSEKYKEMDNPKVKEAIDKIANAKRETKKFGQHVVCTLHKQMENLEKMKDEEIVIKYCDDVLTSNDNAQQDWMKSKKELEDKYPEIWNNPQVKKVFENIKYIIKNIIETVRTEAIEYRKTINSAERKGNSSHLGIIEKVKNGFDGIKNQVENTLKGVIEKKSEIINGAKDSIKKMVESFKNHTSNGSKPMNSDEEEGNSTTLDSEDEEKETLNELKKKFDETLKELKEKWSNHSESPNSEDEEEDSTTLDWKDEAKKTLNEYKKKLEELLKNSYDKSKLKEIIEKIQKLKSSTPKPLNSEDEEENSMTSDWKDEAKKALKEYKKKLEELLKNSYDKSKLKEIIEKIQKLKSSTPKPLNSEDEEEDSTTLDWKDEAKKTLNEYKKKLEELLKNSYDKSKLKEIIEKIQKLKSSTPKPLNSEDEEEDSTTLDWKDEAKKTLNEYKKKLEELLKNSYDKSKLKEIIEKIHKLKSSTPKPLNSEDEEEDSTTLDWKDEAKKTLNEYKKKLEELLKNSYDKSKLKEIIEKIQKLKSSTPKPLNSEDEEENSMTSDWKDEAKKALKEYKKKLEELLKNSYDKSKLKEIIEKIQKLKSSTPKPLNSEDEEENSTTSDWKDEAKKTLNEYKKKLEELLKNSYDKSKLKEIIEKIQKLKSSTPKPLNSEDEEENSMTSDWKDEAKKALNEYKKKLEELLKNSYDKSKLKEIIEKIQKLKSSTPKPLNSEDEEENSTTSDWKDEAKKALNELKKKLEELLKELLNDPKVKEITEAIKKEICKPPEKPGNPENEEELKDGEKKDSESGVMDKTGKEAWDNFKKKVEELLKKILPPSKVDEIIEGVKNATCSTPKPGNSETGEENSGILGLKKKAQEAWNDFKKNNPRVNEAVEEWKKLVKQGKDTANEIIKSVINKNNEHQELS